jgi:hypothetical protein
MPSRWLYFTEPVLKIILPFLYVSVELYFDHSDGFQYLQCPKGTLYAGRFALSHINNWQHAATYPPLVISGIIDILGATLVPFPQGTGHVFLAASFAVQAFVMGTHKKHKPQDAMVHWLLFLAMLLCFLFVILELHAPKNPLPALGRGAAAIFLGAWLCVIGKIEFEQLPQWSEEYPGGVMLAPIYFVSVAVLVLCAVTALGLIMVAVRHLNIVPRVLLQPEENASLLNSGDSSHGRDSSTYLELTRRDAPQHDGSINKLLPLSAFETDSARHTTSSTTSSGGESPRSSRSFAFSTHHNPQDLV